MTATGPSICYKSELDYAGCSILNLDISLIGLSSSRCRFNIRCCLANDTNHLYRLH